MPPRSRTTRSRAKTSQDTKFPNGAQQSAFQIQGFCYVLSVFCVADICWFIGYNHEQDAPAPSPLKRRGRKGKAGPVTDPNPDTTFNAAANETSGQAHHQPAPDLEADDQAAANPISTLTPTAPQVTAGHRQTHTAPPSSPSVPSSGSSSPIPSMPTNYENFNPVFGLPLTPRRPSSMLPPPRNPPIQNTPRAGRLNRIAAVALNGPAGSRKRHSAKDIWRFYIRIGEENCCLLCQCVITILRAHIHF